MDMPAKKQKFLEQAFSTPNHNGNLYNQENDKPVNDRPMVETGANQKVIDEKRLERTKVGAEIQYNGTEGTVIKREGEYLTIYNKDHERNDIIHISDTYFQDDIIMNVEAQLWDKMNYEARMNILGKAKIHKQAKDFVHRNWFDLPESLRDVIKSSEHMGGWSETPHGGMAGREQGFNDKTQESQNFRDLTNNPHVSQPYKDKTPAGLSKELSGSSAAAVVGGHKGEDEDDKEKSDVEHGVYGGVVTDTPFDATDEYEDDRPDKPLSGAQEEIANAPSGQSGGSTSPARHPEEPDKGDPKWSEQNKGEQQQAAITGKPDLEKEGVSSSTPGVTNPVYGDGPKRNKALELRNKYNTRWGIRYGVTKEEAEQSEWYKSPIKRRYA